MKRSAINKLIRNAIRFLEANNFNLPPFAHWTPAVWRRKGPACREIVECGLGWDITDFGLGDFESTGLLLFTIRNGAFANLKRGRGKCYAEKALIVQEGQLTPTHFHFQKTEDIINRGGGDLVVQVWNATKSNALAKSDVLLSIDGCATRVRAGGKFMLKPGQSVCLEDYVYHSFWSRHGTGPVLLGEVSVVNDDHRDNRFLDQIGRFPAIEEDEPPFRLLCNDYAKFCPRMMSSRRNEPKSEG